MLPDVNQRIKEIIDTQCRGRVVEFSKTINQDYQKISRLFKTDNRSGKYPEPSYDIVQSIINTYDKISSDWLLTGRGSMISAEKKPASKFNFVGRDFANDSSSINTGSQVFGSEICNECKKKDTIIFDLQQEISNLKSQIIDLLIKK